MTIRSAIVYDRFLSTLGGGERYACSYAMALRDRGVRTTFVADELVDPSEVGERLRVNVDGISFEVADASRSGEISHLSGGADLFVNLSYLTNYVPLSTHSLLAVHFPEARAEDLVRRRLDAISLEEITSLIPSHVFTGAEAAAPCDGVVIGHDTELHLLTRGTRQARLVLSLPTNSLLATASVRVESKSLSRHFVISRGERHVVPLERYEEGSKIALSGTSLGWKQAVELRPGEVVGPLATIEVVSGKPRVQAETQARRIRAVRTYSEVHANSAFTANWIERLWGIEPTVMYPAASPSTHQGKKSHKILHVGRFFPRTDGAHYKGQLELLTCYLSLPKSTRESWNLTFIGGAGRDSEPVLTELMDASESENVTVITNAPGAIVQDQLDQAAIYWHATGFNGNAVAAQQEHFGIATVEAMAAGAVPVVIDRAGQREIVTNGVDGYRWSTREELIAATMRLVDDRDLRSRMTVRAQHRSKDFSEAAFRRRLNAVIDRLEHDEPQVRSTRQSPGSA